MPDPRITKLARTIVDYSTRIKAGDQVFIAASPTSTPLVQELYKLAVQRGAHPLVQADLPGLNAIFLEHASEEQLRYVSPVLKQIVETFDVRIAVRSEVNTRELSGIDPARQAARAQAMRPLLKTSMERGATGALRWNVVMFPTNAYAQDADMSLSDFEDFVYAACLCDQPDPVASWQQVEARQQVLVDWLRGRREAHLIGADTDLTIGIEGRTFANSTATHNMPSGEIFTGPEETKVNGHIRFSFPAVTQGREVVDVRLWFENGVVVKWAAAKNEDFLSKMLSTDEGARRLGEFAFGANFGIQRFIKNILFDEKIGGTVHLALGSGYPETGSLNQSAIHWDMICDLRQGGQVTVDGELFMKDGKYVLWE